MHIYWASFNCFYLKLAIFWVNFVLPGLKLWTECRDAVKVSGKKYTKLSQPPSCGLSAIFCLLCFCKFTRLVKEWNYITSFGMQSPLRLQDRNSLLVSRSDLQYGNWWPSAFDDAWCSQRTNIRSKPQRSENHTTPAQAFIFCPMLKFYVICTEKAICVISETLGHHLKTSTFFFSFPKTTVVSVCTAGCSLPAGLCWLVTAGCYMLTCFTHFYLEQLSNETIQISRWNKG